jgi:archaellum biogenesis protein FlaJ (TadC family)
VQRAPILRSRIPRQLIYRPFQQESNEEQLISKMGTIAKLWRKYGSQSENAVQLETNQIKSKILLRFWSPINPALG